MGKLNVHYKTEIITDDDVIRPEGFASIYFRNEGDDTLNILNDIEITTFDSNPDKAEFFFINREIHQINIDIPVKFAGVGVAPKLLVLKTFYM